MIKLIIQMKSIIIYFILYREKYIKNKINMYCYFLNLIVYHIYNNVNFTFVIDIMTIL